MNNKFLVIAMVAIVLMVSGFVVFNQSNTQPVFLPTGEIANFNLIFRYGVGAKNELNTFNNTYTKDMVVDSSITIQFELTNDELAGIYKKINDLKLLEKEKQLVEGNIVMIVSPCSSYYLKVQIDGTQTELSWDNCNGKISDKFQKFTNYVISIIESKEEYKKLPRPRGGYL